MNMEPLRPLAFAVLVSLAGSACAPSCRGQGELERLGGGPGGVQGGFFNERAGTPVRLRHASAASPAPSPAPAPIADDESDDAPDIKWNAGLLSVDCENEHIGDFLMEFHRQTGIPVRLEPGVETRVTASFHNLGLERALPILFSAGTWQLVRKPNTALRAPDAYAGLVVRPANTGGTAQVGGMNFGPAFDVPGQVHAAANTVGNIPVETGTEPAAAAEPEPAAAATSAPATTAPAPGSEESRRRIAELLDQRLKKKK